MPATARQSFQYVTSNQYMPAQKSCPPGLHDGLSTAFSFTFGCDIIRHSERGIMRLLHTALAISIAFAGAFAADNPFIGTWKLIPEKSKFAPDPPPPKS